MLEFGPESRNAKLFIPEMLYNPSILFNKTKTKQQQSKGEHKKKTETDKQTNKTSLTLILYFI